MAKKKKSNNKWLYYLIGVLVILVVFLVVAKSAGWIGKPRSTKVEVAEAKKVSITEKVSASGMVQPVVEVKLSPEVSGELIRLVVEEGDPVNEGDTLAKIRPDNIEAVVEQSRASLNQQRANLASSEAALARAKATYTRAKQDYERQKKLWDERVISEADWQLAIQNFEVAQNDLTSAEKSVEASQFIVKSSRANLKQQEENLRRTTVVAPMTGTVSKLNVEQGETVLGTQQFQGTEIMRIADLSQMEVRVDVNENDIIRVGLQDSVIIDVDSYSYLDKKFKGVVTAIANTANDKASADAVTEFEVRILILNSSYADLVEDGKQYPFRPGMTASVEIITNEKDDVLSVPLAAVTTRTEEDFKKKGNNEDDKETSSEAPKTAAEKDAEELEVVFVVGEDNTAELRKIKTGISDYDNIEILEGLEAGDKVVSGPFLAVSKRLKNGDLLEVESKEEKEEDTESEE